MRDDLQGCTSKLISNGTGHVATLVIDNAKGTHRTWQTEF